MPWQQARYNPLRRFTARGLAIDAFGRIVNQIHAALDHIGWQRFGIVPEESCRASRPAGGLLPGALIIPALREPGFRFGFRFADKFLAGDSVSQSLTEERPKATVRGFVEFGFCLRVMQYILRLRCCRCGRIYDER